MYTQYQLDNDPDLHDVFVALLGAAGFDSFQETPDGLLAFATTDRHPEWTAVLQELHGRFGTSHSHTVLQERNWNEAWESQFPPLHVGERLYIRAEFHEPDPDAPVELVITPRMAFGTGHHATTYMMCELLFEHSPEGQAVLDYGCGTGVLAILARRLGAGPTDAVDIEAPAVENTRENAVRNDVVLREIVHGTLADVAPGKRYDLVLANINRNVLLDTGAALYERLLPGGRVFVSGILAADEQVLREHLCSVGFRHQHTRSREGWRAFVFTKP